jgi:RNA polymerase sigma factor (sigma-70 family)
MDERILKAVVGDRDALSDLLVEQHDSLLRFVESKMSSELKGRFEPDDILQETCVAAFQGIFSFQPKSEHSFLRWLQTIAENRLRDAARNLNAQKRGGDLEQVPAVVASETGSMLNLLEVISAELSTPSLKVSREEGFRELRLQIAALAEDYRQAIELKDLQ